MRVEVARGVVLSFVKQEGGDDWGPVYFEEAVHILIAAAEQQGREAERARWYSSMKLAVARAEFLTIDDRIAMSEAVNALGEPQP